VSGTTCGHLSTVGGHFIMALKLMVMVFLCCRVLGMFRDLFGIAVGVA
jgi:hypothetical protein